MFPPVSTRSSIIWPFAPEERVVLLHCCCAVCSVEVIEALVFSHITPIIFFYNPNIYPQDEYFRRKKDVLNFADQRKLRVIDDDYRPEDWSTYVQGLEQEPEGGRRCQKCFDLRLLASARVAQENNIKVFTSTLGISRYKNFDLVCACGQAAASCYRDVIYWDYNWRKKGGSERMYTLSRQQGFYAQHYCGCKSSLSDQSWKK